MASFRNNTNSGHVDQELCVFCVRRFTNHSQQGQEHVFKKEAEHSLVLIFRVRMKLKVLIVLLLNSGPTEFCWSSSTGPILPLKPFTYSTPRNTASSSSSRRPTRGSPLVSSTKHRIQWESVFLVEDQV